MGIVSMNRVKDAVIAAIADEFPEIPILEDGPSEPPPSYFLVETLQATHRRELGQRFRRVHSFAIRHFGSEPSDKLVVAERLCEALELIASDDNTYRASGMTHEFVEDSGFRFTVSYTYLVRQLTTSEPLMETIEQRGGLTT